MGPVLRAGNELSLARPFAVLHAALRCKKTQAPLRPARSIREEDSAAVAQFERTSRSLRFHSAVVAASYTDDVPIDPPAYLFIGISIYLFTYLVVEKSRLLTSLFYSSYI